MRPHALEAYANGLPRQAQKAGTPGLGSLEDQTHTAPHGCGSKWAFVAGGKAGEARRGKGDPTLNKLQAIELERRLVSGRPFWRSQVRSPRSAGRLVSASAATFKPSNRASNGCLMEAYK